jgi:hypothetical protein
MKKTKILIISPYAKDANSFWRCMGPMSYLAKSSGGEIEITLGPQHPEKEPITWDLICQYDVLFLHRPCRPVDLTSLQIAKQLGVPVWIDYDDWLFHLPGWNIMAGTYHNPGIQNIMATCLALADVVSCTTAALHDQFRKVNPNVVVVPNAYRNDLFTYRSLETSDRSKVYLWRGTNTHDGDLNSVIEGFLDLPGKVYFLGNPSWQLLGLMKPATYQQISPQDNLLYHKHIHQLAPKVFLFPLYDCFFNRCKSNIAYIEALHAGALIVAPEFPEWRRQGVVTYEPGNAESFQQAAKQAMEMDDQEHKARVSEAFEEMVHLYGIQNINQIRKAILHALLSQQYDKTNRDPFDELTGMWAISQLRGSPLTQP